MSFKPKVGGLYKLRRKNSQPKIYTQFSYEILKYEDVMLVVEVTTEISGGESKIPYYKLTCLVNGKLYRTSWYDGEVFNHVFKEIS